MVEKECCLSNLCKSFQVVIMMVWADLQGIISRLDYLKIIRC